MSVLKGVLLEEITRLERSINSYQSMLLDLPRGTIFIRKIGDSYYVYRKRKENGKVISIYLGNKDDDDVQKEIELSNEYKRIRNNIITANKELRKLRKAYKVFSK